MTIILKPDLFGDDCCKRVFSNDTYIGMWCRESKQLAVDGEVVGYFSEDALERLTPVTKVVATWGVK